MSYRNTRRVVLWCSLAPWPSSRLRSSFDCNASSIPREASTGAGKVSFNFPQELDGIVEAVLGLDNRPQARTHFRLQGAAANRKPSAAAPAVFTPIQLAALYGYPQATGQGECVGIIEFGGGFKPADLQTYFAKLKVTPPTVVAVSVDDGQNAPTGDANGPDGEVMLDIEVIGAIAPQANIAVYFAPNTDAGFLDAITTAIHDTTNKPSVISISWGSAESTWTAQSMTAMDDAFQAAATLGVTICVASGDNGSSDGVTDGGDHVDFPASSPYALACGGTSLKASKTAITSEVVWNDGARAARAVAGSAAFSPLPTWQSGLQTTGAEGATRRSIIEEFPMWPEMPIPDTGTMFESMEPIR